MIMIYYNFLRFQRLPNINYIRKFLHGLKAALPSQLSLRLIVFVENSITLTLNPNMAGVMCRMGFVPDTKYIIFPSIMISFFCTGLFISRSPCNKIIAHSHPTRIQLIRKTRPKVEMKLQDGRLPV